MSTIMPASSTRSLGLPAPKRNHQGLPNPSINKAESLPGVKTAQPAQSLPGTLPTRPSVPRGLPTPAVKVATALPVVTRKTLTDLPPKMETLQALPTNATKTVDAKTVEALPQGLPVVTSLPAMKVVDIKAVDVKPVIAVKADVTTDTNASVTKRVLAPSVKVPVRKQKVDNKMSFRPTARDRVWLGLIYRYNLLTTNHIAYFDGISPDSARKRLTVLFKQGLIRHDARRSARVWQITQVGIDFIRERGKVGAKFPSLLKYAHTMAIATIGITLEKGGSDASDIVGNLLSEAPRVVITEKEMQVMEGRMERSFIINNWDRLVEDLMHDDRFPHHDYDSFISQDKADVWTAQDWEAFMAIELEEKALVEARYRGTDKEDVNHNGYCHLVTSHNPKLMSNRNFGGKDVQGVTTHRPDALIALPHIVKADGTVTGGSIAIEIELNNKASKTEYKNTILHQYSSKVYSKVFWYFDDTEAKRMFMEAMKELSAMHNAPFTLDEAKDYFRPFNLVLLNADLDAHGLYG